MTTTPNRTIVSVNPGFIPDGFDEDLRQTYLAEALNLREYPYLPSDKANAALQAAWRDHLQFYGEAFMPVVFVSPLPREQWVEVVSELASEGKHFRLALLSVNKQEVSEATGIPLNGIDEWIAEAAETATRSFQEHFTEEVIHNIRQAIDDLREKPEPELKYLNDVAMRWEGVDPDA